MHHQNYKFIPQLLILIAIYIYHSVLHYSIFWWIPSTCRIYYINILLNYNNKIELQYDVPFHYYYYLSWSSRAWILEMQRKRHIYLKVIRFLYSREKCKITFKYFIYRCIHVCIHFSFFSKPEVFLKEYIQFDYKCFKLFKYAETFMFKTNYLNTWKISFIGN